LLGQVPVEPGARGVTQPVAQHRGPAEQQSGDSQGLPGPRREVELVLLRLDQSAREAERRPDVVHHRSSGLGERVPGDPSRRAALRCRLALDELDREVRGTRRQHPPHGTWLGAAQIGKHRVREPGVRCVARGHGRAVPAVERGVEAVEQSQLGIGHPRTLLTTPATRHQ